jgi:2-oxo-4-hydroxy-4-carboxy-5-ureidoimidazoline decarboxylase
MQGRSTSLAALNEAPKTEFMRVLGDVVEHSPWVAERAFSRRPYLSLDDLNAKLMACIREAADVEKIELFNRHPELAGREVVAAMMTEGSTSEQDRLGLTRLQPQQYERLSRLNREHRSKFGFPFIAALRLHGDLVRSSARAKQVSTTDPKPKSTELCSRSRQSFIADSAGYFRILRPFRPLLHSCVGAGEIRKTPRSPGQNRIDARRYPSVQARQMRQFPPSCDRRSPSLSP